MQANAISIPSPHEVKKVLMSNSAVIESVAQALWTAEWSLMVRDIVHWLFESETDQAVTTESVDVMIKEVHTYVPDYKWVNGPVVDDNRMLVYLELKKVQMAFCRNMQVTLTSGVRLNHEVINGSAFVGIVVVMLGILMYINQEFRKILNRWTERIKQVFAQKTNIKRISSVKCLQNLAFKLRIFSQYWKTLFTETQISL